MCALLITTTSIWNIFLSEEYPMIYEQKRNHASCKVADYHVRSKWKLKKKFENVSDIRFCENRSGCSQIIPCVEPDGQPDLANLAGTPQVY
jgi:hypothetical protein